MFASFQPSFLAFKFTFSLLFLSFISTIFVSIIYLFMFPFTPFVLQCFVFFLATGFNLFFLSPLQYLNYVYVFFLILISRYSYSFFTYSPNLSSFYLF